MSPGPATPLRVAEWQRNLSAHPNQPWVQHLITGLQEGFRVGYQGERQFRLSPNLPSAMQWPDIRAYLTTECHLGRIVGPLADPTTSLQTYVGGNLLWRAGMERASFSSQNFTPAEDLQLSTDAPGSTGFGAYFNGQWLNGG